MRTATEPAPEVRLATTPIFVPPTLGGQPKLYSANQALELDGGVA